MITDILYVESRSRRSIISENLLVKDVPDRTNVKVNYYDTSMAKFSDLAYDSKNGNKNIIRSID